MMFKNVVKYASVIGLSLVALNSYCAYTQVDLFTAIKDADIAKVKLCVKDGVDATSPLASAQVYTPLIFALEYWHKYAYESQIFQKAALYCFAVGLVSGTGSLILHVSPLQDLGALAAKFGLLLSGVGCTALGLLYGGVAIYISADKYLEIVKFLIKNPTTDVAFKTTVNQTAWDVLQNIKIFYKKLVPQVEEIEELLLDRLAEQPVYKE